MLPRYAVRHPARTAPRLSESIACAVGSFVGSVSSPLRPRTVPCSAPLLPFGPFVSSTPATPSHRIACIASVRSQLSGPDVFSDKSFSGASLFTLATHHSPIRVCACVLRVRVQSFIHPVHLTRSSSTFTYSMCILAVGFTPLICMGYLLIHPSVIQLSIHPLCLSHPAIHAAMLFPATSGLPLVAIGRSRLVRLRPAGDASMLCIHPLKTCMFAINYNITARSSSTRT